MMEENAATEEELNSADMKEHFKSLGFADFVDGQ